jgi:antitoxin VapB
MGISSPGGGHGTTKVFQGGNSQAVRIPRGFQFDVTEVEIERHGDEIVLRPLVRILSAAFAVMTDMPEGFFAEDRQDAPPQTHEGLSCLCKPCATLILHLHHPQPAT